VSTSPPDPQDVAARFRRAYAQLREREGRGAGGMEHLLALPYVRTGPWSGQWRVRARTYERFVGSILRPLERAVPRPIRVLDLGAGNGWLSYRLLGRGHTSVAVDWRHDDVDGLGAASAYAAYVNPLFARIAASFEVLPFADACCDLVVYNASIHYTTNLATTLSEATRVLVPGGRIVILDSPFYRHARDGEAMVVEKRSGATLDLGEATADLLALPSIEYLTRDRLAEASQDLDLAWRRYRVLYPLAYEIRPLVARLRGRRIPSRFDVWEGRRV
jgi:SAM-dependent methyltransferase